MRKINSLDSCAIVRPSSGRTFLSATGNKIKMTVVFLLICNILIPEVRNRCVLDYLITMLLFVDCLLNLLSFELTSRVFILLEVS